MVNSESADPKFSIGSNWKNRFYPMNEPEDVLLCEKVREKGWTDEKIAAEIPVQVRITYIDISVILYNLYVTHHVSDIISLRIPGLTLWNL